MNNQELTDKIRYVLCGNEEATVFFLMLRDVLHFWDDLIDKDKEITPEYVHQAMYTALVRLPENRFYRAHQDRLLATVNNAIANWHAANKFEETDEHKLLQLAFVIRSDYANILIQCAFIVGGYEWARSVTPMIRQIWTSEDYEAYLRNLEAERAARNPQE